MTADPIPDDVKQFILDNIDSVAQLEGLLLLRDNPETAWSVEAISQRLYIDEQQAAAILAHLNNLKFIVKRSNPPSYHYQPAASELREIVDRVAETYARILSR